MNADGTDLNSAEVGYITTETTTSNDEQTSRVAGNVVKTAIIGTARGHGKKKRKEKESVGKIVSLQVADQSPIEVDSSSPQR